MQIHTGIDEGGRGGGTVQIYPGGHDAKKNLRFLCHERASGAIWGSDARLETIKWPFLD